MNRLIGKYCKIVTKEPGDERVSVIYGVLEEIDFKNEFILIDSDEGLGLFSFKAIVAVKPGHKRNLLEKKILTVEEASVGIGTLIIFIAMILIAAVASTVLIQTSNALQQRALSVGSDTTKEVSSGLKIVGITGYTNELKTKVEYLAISIQPRAGSGFIDLEGTKMYINYNNMSVVSLDYSDEDVITNNVGINGIFHCINLTNISGNEFGCIAVRDTDNSITNVHAMSRNDLAILIINLSAILQETSGLDTNTEITGNILPETGIPGVFNVYSPKNYKYRIVEF